MSEINITAVEDEILRRWDTGDDAAELVVDLTNDLVRLLMRDDVDYLSSEVSSLISELAWQHSVIDIRRRRADAA